VHTLYTQCVYIFFIIFATMAKKERLNVRIEKETKEKLFALAKRHKRNPSDYLMLLIEMAIEENIKL